jgi:uncharacterized membrane protein YphA (DoxX/SURF4 family)
MGMRPPPFWAWVSAFAELAGGLAFALGFLLPFVAAALTIQMAVAIARVQGQGLLEHEGRYRLAAEPARSNRAA